MTGTIFAVFMLLLPGMDEPRVQRIPVASYNECMQVISRLLTMVAEHDGIEQKAVVACEVNGVKADPA